MEEDVVRDIDVLCEAYYRDVYQFCLYFTNNKNDAEDLTQETFVKVLNGLSHFHHRAKVKTWILSIAKNTAIDHYRRKKIIKFLPEIFINERMTESGVPDEVYRVKEEWQEVEIALISLKPLYRNVIILKGIQELSNKETAEILGCNETKVRVTFHRAIKQLHTKLSMPERGYFHHGR
ncbi:RNA polymerase sigma factor [Evansella sp. AB-rgal1]|uniref:RNA polymerase sigma factor n=1 Tax=Evansella sp. AB-rgal1 TaxID=3242696 RepID=UPI00359CCDA9